MLNFNLFNILLAKGLKIFSKPLEYPHYQKSNPGSCLGSNLSNKVKIKHGNRSHQGLLRHELMTERLPSCCILEQSLLAGCWRCVMLHDSCLSLTQQCETGTAGARETSHTVLKPCCPSETAPNFKVLANQNKMNTGRQCERGREVTFVPKVGVWSCGGAAPCAS